MVYFKRKNLLNRRACSSCVLPLALAPLLLFYVFLYRHSLTQSQLVSPDIDLNSDTKIQRLRFPGGTAQDNSVIVPPHPRRYGSNSSSGPVMNRFIIGINYWEQLTMAMINMYRLVCLGERWNASVVQPFTLDSRLYGLRNFKADEKINNPQPAYDLNLIYDTEKLSSLLVKHKLPSLTNFDDFLKFASRQLIVIHYIPVNEVHELKVMSHRNGSQIRSELKRGSVVDCSSYLKGYGNRLTKALNEELKAASIQGSQFTVFKYICVNMSVLMTPQQLGTMVDIPSSGDMSVVIVNWRGTSKNTVINNAAKGAHLNRRISMANVCQVNILSGLVAEVLPHSSLVSETVGAFANTVGLSEGQEFIAVHLRSEKIGLRESRFPKALEICIGELMTVRTQLANSHPDMNIIDFTDFGPYSSDTCKNCWSSKTARKMYIKLGIKPVHFDPILFDVPIDRGFASAVDIDLLASSSYLVLCGGGAFQSQVARRFLASGKTDDRLIQVCVTDTAVADVLKSHG